MSGLVHANYRDFATSAYADYVSAAYTVGLNSAIDVLQLVQPAGHYPDAPCDALCVFLHTSRPARSRFDLGAGRFATRMREGMFVVCPPRTASDFLIDDAHEVIALSIAAPILTRLHPDEGGLSDDALGSLAGRASEDAAVSTLIRSVWQETIRPLGASALFFDSAALVLTTLLSRVDRSGPAGTARGGLAPWQLRRVLDLIEANLVGDIDLATLAAEVRLSPFHFCRAFKASMGVPPHRYQQQRRVERAKELLRAPGLPIIEVAAAVGYENPSHFAALFRRFTGTTPSAWRREVER